MTPPDPGPARQARPPLADVLARAIARHQRVHENEARRICQAILAADAEKFDALHYFGVLEAQQGRYVEADCLLAEALAIRPGSAEACLNHGNVLNALDRSAEALASLDRALAIKPDFAMALNSRGAALLGLGQPVEALASFDQALAAEPGYVEALSNRGNALRDLRRTDEALASYDRALALRPDHAEALSNRGNILLDLRQHGAALENYGRALTINPGFADAHLNRGTALRHLGRYREALESYDRALALRPDLAEALCNRGQVLQELQRPDEAVAAFQRLVDAQPGYDYARGHLLHAQQHCCEWAQFEDSITRITGEVRVGRRAALPFQFLSVSGSAADQLQCARIHAADKYPASPRAMWKGERYRHEKIRIAYLSADFHTHAMTRLMAGVFEAHDRTRFETTAMSFGPDIVDGMRNRLLAAFDRFIDVRNKSDYEAAALLRELEIDIAVDLKGYTVLCRTGIFSHRAVPVQASYLGYPGTLGADYIDYILADRFVIPEEHHPCYTEKVVYLPDSYLANDSKRPIPGLAPTRAAAGLPERGFVFCSFNNNYKITPGTFDVWMRILRRTEGSVLWLLEDNATAARNLRLEAARRGIVPQRLVFASRTGLDEYLARQQLADLFLDTLPYNAHTTASDALWAGLPVLTCLGTTFAGRVAASLLNAVGLPELITHTLEQYEELAVKLAHDDRLLKDVAAKLAQNRATCPLFDTDRTRRHIEAAYTTMWERCQQGEPPADFSVGGGE